MGRTTSRVSLDSGTINDINIESLNGSDLVEDNSAAPANEYPLPVGGQYNATLPTYDDGDRTTDQFTSVGAKITSIYDSNGNIIESFGGLQTTGYTVAVEETGGSYTFDASAKTVTLSGIADLTDSQIVGIVNMTDGIIICDPKNPNLGFSLSSNVITLEYDTTSMSNTDKLLVLVNYKVGVDYDNDVYKNSKQNQNDFISVEHVIDSTNDDTTTIRTIIEWEGKRGGTFHLKCSGGVTMTVWASNDSSADDTADTGWVEVGEDWLEMPAGGLVDDEDIYVLDTQIMPERLMIKYVTSDATNATDAWINSYNPF